MATEIQPGDRIALWAPNSLAWIQVGLAVHCAGGVLVPVNTRFKGAEATDLIRRSGARLVFTVSDFLGTDYAALVRGHHDIPSLEEIVVVTGRAEEGSVSFEDFLARGDKVTDSQRAAARGGCAGR